MNARVYAERAVDQVFAEDEDRDPEVLFEECCERFDELVSDRSPQYATENHVEEVHRYITKALAANGVDKFIDRFRSI